MGYNTDFDGALNIEPPMCDEHRRFINDNAKSMKYPDLPDCPQAYLQWVISDDGKHLEWDGNEKFYEYEEWLDYLLREYLTPWGYKVNGEISWRGAEDDDRGTIYVKDNVAESVQDDVVNPGPSWAKRPDPQALTPRERATVLAALRLWQRTEVTDADLLAIASEGRDDLLCGLAVEEIDVLCERLNIGEPCDELPPSCECDNTHQANDTVCRWCWAHGRRHWNDAEVTVKS
jgi:hypothetical protein